MERTTLAPTELAARLADWQPLHEMADTFPVRLADAPGRPPLYPVAALLIFGCLSYAFGTQRRATRVLADAAVWEPIRAVLARRYPGYRGLERGVGAPTRHHYRRFEEKYAFAPDRLEVFHDEVRIQACGQSRVMGMFDSAAGTVTRPSVKNIITGDGTVIRPRLKAKLGDRHLNPETGELEQRRYDPDAADYGTWDPDSGKNVVVRGIKFGLTFAHLPARSNQRVILDVFYIPTGDGGEAARAIESIGSVHACLGRGAQAVCWDMALRGVHKDQIYDLGLMPIVKVPRASGGAPKGAQLGPYPFTRRGKSVETREVFAEGGAPLIEEIVGGERTPVFLSRRRTRRVGQRTNGFRWYNDYVVPDEPTVPDRLRGAMVSIRLNRSVTHATNHNRAENISAVADNDADWNRLYASRPVAESVNSLIKRGWYQNRAPRVGAPRNHFSLLCTAIWINHQSWTEYLQDSGHNGSPHPEPVPDAPVRATTQATTAHQDANPPPLSEPERPAA